MEADTLIERSLGRPRDARTDRAILQATLELVGEVGVHAFRMDDVAALADPGTGAIYRRYRTRAATAAVTSSSFVRYRR